MRTNATGRLAIMGMLVLAPSLAACDPPPPPRTFEVNETGSGADADPGDGVCEVTVGSGDCTLEAAMGEADSAADPAVVLLPQTEASYPALNWDVVHDITIRAIGVAAPENSATVAGHQLHVGPSGRLVVERVSLGPGELLVQGAFVGAPVAIYGTDGPAIEVGVGGSALLVNSYLGTFLGGPSDAVVNAGEVWLVHSNVAGPVRTDAGATTRAQASAVLASGAACPAGPISSGGYNLVSDASCALAGAGDVVGDPTGDDPFPPEGSPRRDAIPVGVLGCGTDFLLDIRGAARPADGDGDGVAACDIGAWEA